MEKLLKDKGLKITPAQLAILEIFSKSKIPFDAETLFKNLKKTKNSKNTNEVTVYRVLFLFEQNGILKRVDLRKDSVHFELTGDHHHHVVCTKCSKVEDFKNHEIEKLLGQIVEKMPRLKAGFKKITEHPLELFGLCRTCA